MGSRDRSDYLSKYTDSLGSGCELWKDEEEEEEKRGSESRSETGNGVLMIDWKSMAATMLCFPFPFSPLLPPTNKNSTGSLRNYVTECSRDHLSLSSVESEKDLEIAVFQNWVLFSANLHYAI